MINKTSYTTVMDKGLKKSFNLSGNCHLLPYCLLFIVCYLLFPSAVRAQDTFTQHLTRQVAGEGRVVLHQDAEIDALVNSPATHSANHSNAVKPVSHGHAETDSTSIAADPTRELHTGHRSQAVGYRIQVYAGGNSRKSKSEAHYMGNLVRSNFGNEMAVYTSFISPRWVCRVGDFKTREEAVEQLRKMRATQQFSEASIVKSKIYVYY